jgi:myo-inositol 2-dehydrogenase/D-chiro-inositol 1-dehydrogenase
MGKIHLHNCLRLKNAELISVADSSRKELKFAEKVGVKNAQEDYNKLLNDPNIDAVIVSLPNFLHCECVKRAAEAGKDIFLEKPLARNAAEGEEILSCVRRAGVKLMMGYPSRFNEPFIRLKDELQSGTYGDIQVAVGANTSTGPFSPRGEMGRPAPVPAWWFTKELTGGGALLDLGIHLISLFRWYFGDVSDAKSYLGHRFNMDFEDYALCLLKFKAGPTATVNVGWFSKEARVSVELYGTVKHVAVVHSYPRTLAIIADDIRRKLGRIERSLERYYKELQHFVECLSSDTQPSPSGEEGLLDLKIISMAYKNSFQFDS